MADMKKALIIGASRGLGLAIAKELLERGWDVIGTVRANADTELHSLSEAWKDKLKIQRVDIESESEIEQLKLSLAKDSLNLLFVCAGVASKKGMDETVGEVSTEEFSRIMIVNTLSPMRVLEQLASTVVQGGVMGVMSSGQGSIADNERGRNDVYRASKAALNMIMRSFAARDSGTHALLLLAPGWIKTDLGGDGAKFSVEEVIKDIVNTIVSQAGTAGLCYLDRFGQVVRW